MPSAEFEDAAKRVNDLTAKPNDNELLELYGLYKQATVGKCNTPKPSFYNIRDQAKWKAWDAQGDKSQEEAEKEYIALVQKYEGQYKN